MLDVRGELEVETLLKIVLALVAVLLVIEVLEAIIGSITWLLGPFVPLVQFVIALLIVLWLLDRL